MNDSFGRITSPSPTANNGGRSGQLVQIVTLPDALQNNARGVRLEGQITQINRSGTVNIATAEGSIEVQVRGNREPQVGQRVEVDVPAGRPPRQATVRDAPREGLPRDGNIRTQTTTNAPNVQNTGTQNTNVQASAATTRQVSAQGVNTTQQSGPNIQPTSVSTAQQQPVQNNLPPALQEAITTQNTNNTNAQAARALTAEAIVRLLPVPPAQANVIAADYVAQLPQAQNASLARAALSASITAQNVQNQQPQILLQSLPATAPTTQNLNLQPSLQNTSQAIINTNFSQNIGTSQTALLTPSIPLNLQANLGNLTLPILSATATLTPGQILPPSIANNFIAQTGGAGQSANIVPATPSILTAGQNTTLIPLTFDPTNPAALTSARADKIDIQIVKITPPNALITPNIAQSGTLPPVPATTAFTPPLLGANNAVTLTAQVTGFTANNLPLITVQFPNTTLPQSFVLQQNTSNLVLGTQLQITPRMPIAAFAALPTLPATGLSNPLLQGFQWPALNDLYTALQTLSPQAASSLSRALPNAGNPAQMAPAAMMFMAAVKSGDIATWLGQSKTDMLERIGKSDILSRLTQGGGARAGGAEPSATASDWRAVPLPMFWEGEIHRVTLYTKYDGQNQNEGQQKGGQTRFIFDLSLSRMGDIQLDGLLRGERLDLVIRAQNTFSVNMQQVMRQAYSSALDNAQLNGELNFQGTTKNWVHVLEEKAQLGVHV